MEPFTRPESYAFCLTYAAIERTKSRLAARSKSLSRLSYMPGWRTFDGTNIALSHSGEMKIEFSRSGRSRTPFLGWIVPGLFALAARSARCPPMRRSAGGRRLNLARLPRHLNHSSRSPRALSYHGCQPDRGGDQVCTNRQSRFDPPFQKAGGNWAQHSSMRARSPRRTMPFCILFRSNTGSRAPDSACSDSPSLT